MYNSITYGKLTKEQMFEKVAEKLRGREEDFTVYVGTDSQSNKKTKIVTVVAVVEHGKGGIFFYEINWMKKISIAQLRIKIYNETMRSIDLSKELTEFLFNNDLPIDIIIHVDVGRGKKSKTSEMIAELIGWCGAEGFEAHAKPDSFVASTIADKISK